MRSATEASSPRVIRKLTHAIMHASSWGFAVDADRTATGEYLLRLHDRKIASYPTAEAAWIDACEYMGVPVELAHAGQ